MENWYYTILITHVVSGYVALTSGAVVMLTKKGNRLHRLLGKIFFYSMMGVTASSFALSIYKNIPFLFYIGIFVFYQAYSGFFSVKNRSLNPHKIDYLVLLVAFVNGIFMLKTLNPILMVFGGISLFLNYTDLRIYYALFRKKEIKKLTWLTRHIGMMMGAYIGTFTAFLVVNIKGSLEYSWLIWLGPTFILVPLMRYWTWKYTRKPLSKIKPATHKMVY